MNKIFNFNYLTILVLGLLLPLSAFAEAAGEGIISTHNLAAALQSIINSRELSAFEGFSKSGALGTGGEYKSLGSTTQEDELLVNKDEGEENLMEELAPQSSEADSSTVAQASKLSTSDTLPNQTSSASSTAAPSEISNETNANPDKTVSVSTQNTSQEGLSVSAEASATPLSADQRFDSEAQIQAITTALKKYYSLSEEAEMILSPLVPLQILDKTPVTVEILSVPEHPAATMLVRVRYLNADKTYTDLSTTCRAQWKVDMFVPRRQLARAEVLNPADFEIQRVDRLSMNQMPVATTLNLSDYQTAMPLSAGTPLTWNYLKSKPLVRKGALVDVVAQEGPMRITTRALALQDAGRGEQVIMRNTGSLRQFEAYVINENLVQIRF